jgi:hypothetical protein
MTTCTVRAAGTLYYRKYSLSPRLHLVRSAAQEQIGQKCCFSGLFQWVLRGRLLRCYTHHGRLGCDSFDCSQLRLDRLPCLCFETPEPVLRRRRDCQWIVARRLNPSALAVASTSRCWPLSRGEKSMCLSHCSAHPIQTYGQTYRHTCVRPSMECSVL